MRRLEQARLLLENASQDEALLDEVIDSVTVSDEIIGFHLQQAAEKILKALLIEAGISFRRVHNLKVLADLLSDAGRSLPLEFEHLDAWTPYATLLSPSYS